PQAKIAIRHFSKSDSIIMIPIDPNEQFYQIEIDDIEIQSQCCEIAFIADFTDDGTTRLYIDKVAFFHEKSAGAKPSPTTPRREITVYPNPFSQQLTFEYIPENERQQITIYTITGIVIDQFEKNVTPCIPATIHRQLPVSLPSGIYIYRILDGESVISGRIVRG
ncbi:T9SS type A sorting domain-containing protein, partial [Bacteroidales bacterium OttesenSCG-928-C03]|nr:T9SS type A sorting domain-containing protein [Bacteroidales bacterium OttesenSCG-928-C03]